MAEEGPASPFAADSKVKFAPGTEGSKETSPEMKGRANSFKLVASPSGKDLFVETKEYDPLAPHRPRDAKGAGLGFLCSCFGASVKGPVETAATAERHYSLPASLPASESMTNLVASKED